jgi:flagellar biosynthesis protein FliR
MNIFYIGLIAGIIIGLNLGALIVYILYLIAEKHTN